ncbi:MAG: GGDEF domain-containing protein, partial [Actinobacteria bacterium]|nr:GGDEF domain-containing protein [Actinomycetota bacterium]
LEREMARSSRAREALSVAFIDVDHLKQVNDTRGHAAGDRLLQHVADALRSRLRSYDLVVRYGGDEFICVMPGSAPKPPRTGWPPSTASWGRCRRAVR